MTRARPSPGSLAVLAAVVLLLATEAALYPHMRGVLADEWDRHRQAEQRLSLALRRAPSEANARLAEAEAQTWSQAARAHAELWREAPRARRELGNDVFWRAEFAALQRERLAEAGVRLEADLTPLSRLESLPRERLERLLAIVAEARAVALVYLQVESPPAPSSPPASPSVPLAFVRLKLGVVGDGEALRVLLNRLAVATPPFLVRSVEVEPSADSRLSLARFGIVLDLPHSLAAPPAVAAQSPPHDRETR